MTRTTIARTAGFTFLAYIAATFASMSIFGGVAGNGSTTEKLAAISAHAAGMHIVILLAIFQAFAALVLAVTLYSITRDQDRDVAILAMACRLTEGMIGGVSASGSLALLWVATASGPNAPPADAARVLAGYLLRDDSAIPALFFAVGSTLFACLLLRGRMIPVALAWLGIVASILLVIGLPAQLVSLVPPIMASLMWLPMLAFEIALGLWLLIKGAGAPQPTAFGHTGTASANA